MRKWFRRTILFTGTNDANDMKSLRITSSDGATVEIERIDISYVGVGLLTKATEDTRRCLLSEFVTNVKEKYGSYRPIQIVTPFPEEEFDYAVFVDMHKHCKEELLWADLGLLLFCTAKEVTIENIQNKASDLSDWSQAETYSL